MSDFTSDNAHELNSSWNPFSYGTSIKLNGSDYDIWSPSFLIFIKGHEKNHLIEEVELTDNTGKHSPWKKENSMGIYIDHEQCRCIYCGIYFVRCTRMIKVLLIFFNCKKSFFFLQ